MANAEDYGYFWNAKDADRTYNADSFSMWLKKFFTTGVFEGDLQVSSAGGMDVVVGPGYANVQGKVRFFEEQTRFTVLPPESSKTRKDTIIVRCSYLDRQISVKYVTGGMDAVPPVRDASAYDLVLAEILVREGTTQLTQADITDMRPDPQLCGIVSGTVKEIDFSMIQKQFNEYIDAKNQDYNTWLDTSKSTFSQYAFAGIDFIEGELLFEDIINPNDTITLYYDATEFALLSFKCIDEDSQSVNSLLPTIDIRYYSNIITLGSGLRINTYGNPNNWGYEKVSNSFANYSLVIEGYRQQPAFDVAADVAKIKLDIESKADDNLLPRCMTEAQYNVLADRVKQRGLFFITME